MPTTRTTVKKRAGLRRAEQQARVASRQIQRRAYWGTGTKINEYREAVEDGVDLSPLEDQLDRFTDEGVVKESLVDDLVQSINFEDLFAAELVDSLRRIVAEAFQQGGSRVLTVDGEKLEVGEVSPRRIADKLRSQEMFLSNLAEDAQSRVRQSLVQGAENGKTVSEMKDQIMDDVEGMVSHRAETIARSEVIQASAEGTRAAMDEAGVEEVVVVAEVDRRTCESGSFSFRVGGREFTSCREWDGEVFNREDAPVPVQSSHPNCRCCLAARVE